MKVRPLHDRIIVQRVDKKDKTEGGLYIPENAKEKPAEGVVVSTGNGKVLEDGSVRPLDVKSGDHILFGKYSGVEIKVAGEDRIIMREDDVLCVIDD